MRGRGRGEGEENNTRRHPPATAPPPPERRLLELQIRNYQPRYRMGGPTDGSRCPTGPRARGRQQPSCQGRGEKARHHFPQSGRCFLFFFFLVFFFFFWFFCHSCRKFAGLFFYSFISWLCQGT